MVEELLLELLRAPILLTSPCSRLNLASRVD